MVFGAAQMANVLDADWAKALTLAVALSMAATPILLALLTRMEKRASSGDSREADEIDEETAAWVEWAMKKAAWFDPTVAWDDELFGKREHEKNATDKALKKYGQYW